MTEMNSSQAQPHTYSRRTFLRAMVGAPFALGALAVAPREAQAKTLKGGYVKVKVPSAWKKIIVQSREHTSGAGISEFSYYLNKKMYSWTDAMRILWDCNLDPRKLSKGKPKVKRTGSLQWSLTRGKVSASVEASNVPLTVWESAHGEGYLTISKAQAKELLKISTGGKIKYGTLIKWSRKKAKKQGAKAVRSWVGKKVVKKIRFA